MAGFLLTLIFTISTSDSIALSRAKHMLRRLSWMIRLVGHMNPSALISQIYHWDIKPELREPAAGQTDRISHNQERHGQRLWNLSRGSNRWRSLNGQEFPVYSLWCVNIFSYH